MHENLVIELEKGVSFLIGNYEAGIKPETLA